MLVRKHVVYEETIHRTRRVAGRHHGERNYFQTNAAANDRQRYVGVHTLCRKRCVSVIIVRTGKKHNNAAPPPKPTRTPTIILLLYTCTKFMYNPLQGKDI